MQVLAPSVKAYSSALSTSLSQCHSDLTSALSCNAINLLSCLQLSIHVRCISSALSHAPLIAVPGSAVASHIVPAHDPWSFNAKPDARYFNQLGTMHVGAQFPYRGRQPFVIGGLFDRRNTSGSNPVLLPLKRPRLGRDTRQKPPLVDHHGSPDPSGGNQCYSTKRLAPPDAGSQKRLIDARLSKIPGISSARVASFAACTWDVPASDVSSAFLHPGSSGS